MSQDMDSIMSHLVNYTPKSQVDLDLEILSKLIEYRDYKFSNGYFYLEEKGIQTLVSKMNITDFELLVDQLYSANTELYRLFKKILMNDSTDSDYRNYALKLEATGVMKYNWKKLNR